MPKKWSSSHDLNQEFIGKSLVGFSGQYWFSPFCVASPTWSVGGGQKREVGREREIELKRKAQVQLLVS